MPAFVLDGVSVAFGALEALRRVTLSVNEGERVAVVGPSGGGKSTLLRLLIGAVIPSEGTVKSLGTEVMRCGAGELRRLRARVGFVLQHPGLTPSLRVSQNIATGRLGSLGFWPAVRHVLFPSAAERTELHRLLGRVGIAEKLFHRTDSLSGGQQQRVAIARALHQHPAALLADEPLSSLDPARARDVLALVTRMSSEDGLTLVVSLHQFDLAREFFPRLVGLRAGRVVFDKASREVGAEEFAALYQLTDAELLADTA